MLGEQMNRGSDPQTRGCCKHGCRCEHGLWAPAVVPRAVLTEPERVEPKFVDPPGVDQQFAVERGVRARPTCGRAHVPQPDTDAESVRHRLSMSAEARANAAR